MIVTGDISQIDLKKNQLSGLIDKELEGLKLSISHYLTVQTY